MNAKLERTLKEAVEAIAEDVADNEASFEWSLQHYAELFEVREDDLRHEWNLLRADCR